MTILVGVIIMLVQDWVLGLVILVPAVAFAVSRVQIMSSHEVAARSRRTNSADPAGRYG
ncbi:predicted protein [Streptomyces viridosporus ATCC 14672]|uniref:Predicted protein n=1 Tax=Streptomyces viridosporus (strain ATCC 14672 / DSM 40746 / JCM 4963 / KCTC 9882 / NRRL B-12104 / FH 1290) TaxID=566461 RepID=D6AAC8_STRV1|nr:predicted protein [Streptomyces viridosporus ATCC 14672]